MRATTCRVVVLLCAVTVTGASAGQHVFTGLRLEEALRLLQQDGLAIVFSSETVTPDMRVGVEPKTTTPAGNSMSSWRCTGSGQRTVRE